MDQRRKRIIFALFIILAFGGSSLAFALDSALNIVTNQAPQKKPDEVIGPLSDSEEAPYLQQNYLIVRYFYSSNCPDCAHAEDAITGLRGEVGPILLEKVPVEQYGNETESLGVTTVPSIYLKGSSTYLFSGAPTYDELFTKACQLYFDLPLACPA